MNQQVTVLAAKPDDQSSIPRTYKVEKTSFQKLCSHGCMNAVAHIHTNKEISVKKINLSCD